MRTHTIAPRCDQERDDGDKMRGKPIKNRKLGIGIVIVIGIAVLYVLTNQNDAEGLTRRQTVKQQNASDMQAEAAAELSRNYTFGQKEEFLLKMKKELVGIQIELIQLTAQNDSAIGLTKIENKRTIKAATEKWTETKADLDSAEKAGESTWIEKNERFRTSYSELMDSVRETRRRFSGKTVA